jgi:hypothetical protein
MVLERPGDFRAVSIRASRNSGVQRRFGEPVIESIARYDER